MDRDEFIELLIDDNTNGVNGLLKHYDLIKRGVLVSPQMFYDSFIQMVIHLSNIEENEEESELYLHLLYNLSLDTIGDITKVTDLEIKEYYSRIFNFLEAVKTLDYAVIDKDNNDYDLLNEIIDG